MVSGRWYVGVVRSTEANDVGRRLGNLDGIEVFLPRYRRAGGTVDTMLFPGYLFLRTDLTVRRWVELLAVRGLVRLLTVAGRPVPLDDEVVEAVRSLVGEDGVYRERMPDNRVMYSVGATVVVVSGPFEGRGGRVIWTDKKGAKINLSPLLSVGLGLYIKFECLRLGAVVYDSAPPDFENKREQFYNPYRRRRRSTGG